MNRRRMERAVGISDCQCYTAALHDKRLILGTVTQEMFDWHRRCRSDSPCNVSDY